MAAENPHRFGRGRWAWCDVAALRGLHRRACGGAAKRRRVRQDKGRFPTEAEGGSARLGEYMRGLRGNGVRYFLAA